ncbi:MAG: helix-turn-helix domain-containing protein [Lachnospiraceae bacterium]
MYRILIADDEGIMLDSLRNIILSNFEDECEIMTVKTGRAAIESEQVFRPDIIFMDIQMPGLSGIQAMKEIRKKNPFVLFIVITAYDKFDYAKEAIAINVFEYLTKPVNKKTVINTLLDAMKQVEQDRTKRSDDLKIREKLEIVIPLIESGFIYNMLLQEEFLPDEDNYRELLSITQKYAYVILLEFGEETDEGAMQNKVGASVQVNNFYADLRDIIRNLFPAIVGPIMGNRVVILVPWESDTVSYEERIAQIKRANNLVHKLEQKIPSIFRAGIGSLKALEFAKESYLEALKALQDTHTHIIHIHDVPVSAKYDGEYPKDLEKRYYQRVRKGDVNASLDRADSFFTWMTEHHDGCLDNIRIKILELVIQIEKDAFSMGSMQYGFRYRQNYLQELTECTELEGLKAWFLDRTSEVTLTIANTTADTSESLISQAITYINQNFQKDISLDDVSRHVDISPYYFSKLFKEEAGENFIEYLTATRMSHAKQLLQNPARSIKEVCLLSGYSDPNYFSRIFKKCIGITPSEYRERLG